MRTIHRKFVDHGWQRTIGCSGTIKAVAASLKHLELSSGTIDKESLAELRSRILQFRHTSELMELGFNVRRSEVIPGGFAIVSALFNMLNIEKMEVSEHALREGVMYDLLGRLRNDDARERTVYALAEHWSVDQVHANRVQAIAQAMYDQNVGTWFERNPEVRNLLLWASFLHEIGLAVTHAKHHEHGSYLLQFTDMAGFSRAEQISLAVLVGSHRRKWPDEFNSSVAYSHVSRKTMKRLCVLLRLAVLLHRPRTDRLDLSLMCHAEKKSVILQFPPGWLNQHPLTMADLKQEKLYLRKAGIVLKVKSS